MPDGSLIQLVLQGGAVVVLLLWVWDLRSQRDQERKERRENFTALQLVTQALKDLTDAVKDGERRRR